MPIESFDLIVTDECHRSIYDTRLAACHSRSDRRRYRVGPADLAEAPELAAQGGIVKARGLFGDRLPAAR